MRKLVSSKDFNTFDAKGPKLSDSQFLSFIKNTNAHALFSGPAKRPYTTEQAHIHFLLKYIEKLESDDKKTFSLEDIKTAWNDAHTDRLYELVSRADDSVVFRFLVQYLGFNYKV